MIYIQSKKLSTFQRKFNINCCPFLYIQCFFFLHYHELLLAPKMLFVFKWSPDILHYKVTTVFFPTAKLMNQQWCWKAQVQSSCVRKTVHTHIYRAQALHTSSSSSLTEGHAHVLPCTHPHAHTECIRGKRWLCMWCMLIMALTAYGSGWGEEGSVSTLWIAKQIQLALPVINIKKQINIFSFTD